MTCEEGGKLLLGCRGAKWGIAAEFNVGKWSPSEERWQKEQQLKQKQKRGPEHLIVKFETVDKMERFPELSFNHSAISVSPRQPLCCDDDAPLRPNDL